MTPFYHLNAEFLKGRSASRVWEILWGFINLLKTLGYVVKALLCDGEGAIAKLRSTIEEKGIHVNLTAKEHVPLIENKVGQVKSRARGILCTLHFRVAIPFLVYLIYFIISGINKIPSQGASEFIAPFTALTGRPVDAADMKLPFMSYVEMHERDQTTNSMAPRTRPAVALYPRDNHQHSWCFWTLDTHHRVFRDKYTPMPMPTAIIKQLDDYAVSTGKVAHADPVFLNSKRRVLATEEGTAEAAVPPELVVVDPAANMEYVVSHLDDAEPEAERPTVHPFEQAVQQEPVPGDPSPEEGVVQADEVSAQDQGVQETLPFDQGVTPEPELPESVIVTAEDQGGTQTAPPAEAARRYPLRANRHGYRDFLRPTKSGYQEGPREELGRAALEETACRININQGLKQFRKATINSMCKELLQIHHRDCFEGVDYSKLTYKQKRSVISSHLFLKEKYSSTGEGEKLKA